MYQNVVCCDLCEGFKYGHVSQEDYNIHQSRKDDARKAKNLEKEFAKINPKDSVSITMDVQAVKMSPFIRASSMYYKTKLCVHNYTVYIIKQTQMFVVIYGMRQMQDWNLPNLLP